jgi:energy-coupling factor transporter ATP-binding protein EcfA2
MEIEPYTEVNLTADRRVVAELRGVSKNFDDVLAASDLNLSIGEGEFLSFLGPSGCGKTTALRMLAGFEVPSEGQVLLDGDIVNDLDGARPPGQHGVPAVCAVSAHDCGPKHWVWATSVPSTHSQVTDCRARQESF